MNKGKLTAPFRKLGLMHWIDKIKFILQRTQNAQKNQTFLRNNPTVKLPPDYMMFESFRLDYEKYYLGGKKSASWIKEKLENHVELREKKILDWGCGPARILRHLPTVINNNCQFFGTDYNAETIAWCEQNIPNINFSHNQINPPLSYAEETFNIIYGISIFTHLSQENHAHWLKELIRITKKGGIILLTMAGVAFKENMTNIERKKFDAGQLVVRGKVVEGHRVYVAFQPPSFVETLFQPYAEILEFTPGKKEAWGINQDLWIIRKK